MQLTRSGFVPPPDAGLHALRTRFGEEHGLFLPAFLEPQLLEWLWRELATARFVTRVHEDLDPPATDEALADPALQAKLFLLMNDAALFASVRALTGCDPVGCFYPVVSRQDPGAGHHDAWHGDVDGNRLIGLSMNVGGRYQGSPFQLRERATERVRFTARHAEPGDAFLFRIAPALQHRVAPLEGTVARTVLVGWFQREPVATAGWPRALPL